MQFSTAPSFVSCLAVGLFKKKNIRRLSLETKQPHLMASTWVLLSDSQQPRAEVTSRHVPTSPASISESLVHSFILLSSSLLCKPFSSIRYNSSKFLLFTGHSSIDGWGNSQVLDNIVGKLCKASKFLAKLSSKVVLFRIRQVMRWECSIWVESSLASRNEGMEIKMIPQIKTRQKTGLGSWQSSTWAKVNLGQGEEPRLLRSKPDRNEIKVKAAHPRRLVRSWVANSVGLIRIDDREGRTLDEPLDAATGECARRRRRRRRRRTGQQRRRRRRRRWRPIRDGQHSSCRAFWRLKPLGMKIRWGASAYPCSRSAIDCALFENYRSWVGAELKFWETAMVGQWRSPAKMIAVPHWLSLETVLQPFS